MNKERRKAIQALMDQIEAAGRVIEALQEEVDLIREDEQDYLDNMPENMQGSEKYGLVEEIISNLDEAVDSLGLSATIEEVLDNLRSAAGF